MSVAIPKIEVGQRFGRLTVVAEYKLWTNMKSRCYNPNFPAYKTNGARGIKVCDRWLFGENGKSAFECFIKDVGHRPGLNYRLCRDNIDCNFDPSNVRWRKNYLDDIYLDDIKRRGYFAKYRASSGNRESRAKYRLKPEVKAKSVAGVKALRLKQRAAYEALKQIGNSFKTKSAKGKGTKKAEYDNEYMRKYRAENREKLAEFNRKYRAENREKLNAQRAELRLKQQSAYEALKQIGITFQSVTEENQPNV